MGFSLGVIIGILIGTFLPAFSGTMVISADYECTATELVGESPHRYEACLQYTLKEQSK